MSVGAFVFSPKDLRGGGRTLLEDVGRPGRGETLRGGSLGGC